MRCKANDRKINKAGYFKRLIEEAYSKYNKHLQTTQKSIVSDKYIKECYEILTDIMVLLNKNLNNENLEKAH